jgi:hypothetical protein
LNSLGPLAFLFVVSLTHVFKSWALGVTALRIPPPAAAVSPRPSPPRRSPGGGGLPLRSPSPAPAWLCPLLPGVAPPPPRWLAGFPLTPSPLRRAHLSTTGVLPLLSPSLLCSLPLSVLQFQWKWMHCYSVSVSVTQFQLIS